MHSKKFKMNEEVDSFPSEKVSNTCVSCIETYLLSAVKSNEKEI